MRLRVVIQLTGGSGFGFICFVGTLFNGLVRLLGSIGYWIAELGAAPSAIWLVLSSILSLRCWRLGEVRLLLIFVCGRGSVEAQG